MLAKVKDIWLKNPTMVLIGIAVFLVVLMFVWGWIKRGISYAIDSVKGVASTLSSDEAKSISATIFAEVNSIMTDEDKIVELVKELTLSDYYKVQAVFGIHPYSSTFDNFDSLTGTDSNLTQVLNQTLSSNDKEKIKNSAPWLPIS